MTRAPLILKVGPIRYRLADLVSGQRDEFAALYGRYPQEQAGGSDAFADFTVGVKPASLLRRFVRPSVMCYGDADTFDVAPMPRIAATLMLEMALNMQVALLHDRHLVMHASGFARKDKAIICCADSGSGKSTLSALLGHLAGWRFLADEFVLLDVASGLIAPHPRPISLKNESIDLARGLGLGHHVACEFPNTHKGRIGFLRAPDDAVAAMDSQATPMALVFPRFIAGATPELIALPRADVFTRLVFSSPNYRAQGEAAFRRLSLLAQTLPSYLMVYPDFDSSRRLVDEVWDRHGG